MENKNVNSGHRQRLKERFLKDGLDSFNDHQVLELLLFFSIPRKDTNKIAHVLLNTFGSISGVFDASPELLEKIPGISGCSTTLIKLIPALSRVYLTDKNKNKNGDEQILSTEQAGKIFLNRFIGRQNEVIILMLLDAKRKMVYCEMLSEGNVDTAPVNIRKMVALVIHYNATAAFIAHNHPSGFALPSTADINTTYIVKRALNSVGAKLLDHLIISDGDYVSLAQSEIAEDLLDK